MMIIGFTIYLYVSTVIFKSSNQFRINLHPDASDEEKAIHGDGLCDFDSNYALQSLIFYSFIPCILIRTYGAVKYHKCDPLDFEYLYQRIEVFWHTTFGGWTLLNLYVYMNISQNCRALFVMSMINYQVTLIAGCFSAVNVMFVIFIIMILVPILGYKAYQHYRERTAHARLTNSLFKHLVS